MDCTGVTSRADAETTCSVIRSTGLWTGRAVGRTYPSPPTLVHPASVQDELLLWTETLTGLEPERTASAREEIESWGYPHVTREMGANTVDSVVAATLLVDALTRLEEAGADHARLLKKIRKDREVWGTWAEIRAAEGILQTVAPGAELRIEEGKSAGAHADLRFLDAGAAMSVEVKAIGLSDQEVAFCQRMTPALEQLLPREGLGHLHAPIHGQPPRLSREQRRGLDREAKRRTKRVPMWTNGLRGAVIVGHGSEESYAQRVGRRVAQAVRQLPTTDPCWVAIYWSNGAPFDVVARSIPWSEIPGHVNGVILVGCGVAFPHSQIHCFSTAMGRDQPLDADIALHSTEAEQQGLAELILERFERSSGVRPTLLGVRNRTLIRRDGSRRILPFNLLMDVDAPGFDRLAEDVPWRR